MLCIKRTKLDTEIKLTLSERLQRFEVICQWKFITCI